MFLLCYLFHTGHQLVKAGECHEVANTIGQDAETNQYGKSLAGSHRIAKAEEAQHGGSQAQQHDAPPESKTEFLEIKRFNEQRHTFNNHPDSKHNRKGGCQSKIVAKEENT